MALFDRVPSPSIAPPRWPGLVASVGGEDGIRGYMLANPSGGGGNRWERGFTFVPNDCTLGTDPLDACSGTAFGECDSVAEEEVDVYPLYFWECAACSTLGNDPDEVSRRARTKLERSTSHKLEYELWTGAGHTALGLASQSLVGDATELLSGSATPLVRALAELQDAWGDCSQGRVGMIHATPRTVSLWFSQNVLVRDGGLLYDVFGNLVVAGTGYDGSSPLGVIDPTGNSDWAYVTPVVQARLSDITVQEGSPTRVDISNNLDLAKAFRAGAVYYDPCCVYGINVDNDNIGIIGS